MVYVIALLKKYKKQKYLQNIRHIFLAKGIKIYFFCSQLECGTTTARGTTLIVNGFEAEIGKFPWHVGIYAKNTDQEYEQICGGTIISSNLVITGKLLRVKMIKFLLFTLFAYIRSGPLRLR